MTHQVNQYDAEDRPHGVWSDYWEDGTLRWRARYLRGELHIYEHYWEDGTLSRRRRFHLGKLRGLGEYYYIDGTLDNKTYFLDIK
jgi:antitoxin component YwqK of YwqJK toxin-antitoxin module